MAHDVDIKQQEQNDANMLQKLEKAAEGNSLHQFLQDNAKLAPQIIRAMENTPLVNEYCPKLTLVDNNQGKGVVIGIKKEAWGKSTDLRDKDNTVVVGDMGTQVASHERRTVTLNSPPEAIVANTDFRKAQNPQELTAMIDTYSVAYNSLHPTDHDRETPIASKVKQQLGLAEKDDLPIYIANRIKEDVGEPADNQALAKYLNNYAKTYDGPKDQQIANASDAARFQLGLEQKQPLSPEVVALINNAFQGTKDVAHAPHVPTEVAHAPQTPVDSGKQDVNKAWDTWAQRVDSDRSLNALRDYASSAPQNVSPDDIANVVRHATDKDGKPTHVDGKLSEKEEYTIWAARGKGAEYIKQHSELGQNPDSRNV